MKSLHAAARVTPFSERVALNIRRRSLSRLAAKLTRPQAQSVSTQVIAPSTFWSEPPGVNVITRQAPVTAEEATQFLRRLVSRIAGILHIDGRSDGKAGRFVRSLRLEAGEMP